MGLMYVYFVVALAIHKIQDAIKSVVIKWCEVNLSTSIVRRVGIRRFYLYCRSRRCYHLITIWKGTMSNGYLAEGSFYKCNITQSQQWLTHQMDYAASARRIVLMGFGKGPLTHGKFVWCQTYYTHQNWCIHNCSKVQTFDGGKGWATLCCVIACLPHKHVSVGRAPKIEVKSWWWPHKLVCCWGPCHRFNSITG